MSITSLRFSWVAAVVLASVAAVPCVRAQKEIPPPQGKGRVVVLASGASGAAHDEAFAREIAKLGYDVVLLDGPSLEGTHGQALKTAVDAAPSMPHALPGKVAVVGVSLGGAVSLGYATMWPEQVATVVLWYPATNVFKDIPGFVARLKVPVLMFAGESDTYKNCCLISTAHALADAAAAANQPFELHTYPKTEHDFIVGGNHYRAESYKDAFDRTAARLKEALGG